MSIAALKDLYSHQWDENPILPFDGHGWCLPEHRDWLSHALRPDAKVVVELGSWLGQSTRLLLELAPRATVICVDTWAGSTDMVGHAEAEPRVAISYQQFLANQWEWRERVIPIRCDSRRGLRIIHEHGVEPDLIFFDTEHTTDHLRAELELAHTLFPAAQLYGDDWSWPSVRSAVEQFALAHALVAIGHGNAYYLGSKP